MSQRAVVRTFSTNRLWRISLCINGFALKSSLLGSAGEDLQAHKAHPARAAEADQHLVADELQQRLTKTGGRLVKHARYGEVS
jgi:hypothetical protein